MCFVSSCLNNMGSTLTFYNELSSAVAHMRTSAQKPSLAGDIHAQECLYVAALVNWKSTCSGAHTCRSNPIYVGQSFPLHFGKHNHQCATIYLCGSTSCRPTSNFESAPFVLLTWPCPWLSLRVSRVVSH